MTILHQRSLKEARLLVAAVLALAMGCGGDETQPNEDHTPVSYTISIDGSPVPAPYTFAAGETVLVRITFFNAAQENLDDVEAGHFAGLTFTPPSLALATRRADHHFQFDVTGQTAGNGTMTVGYGHEDLANEVSFPPALVAVTGDGVPNPQ